MARGEKPRPANPSPGLQDRSVNPRTLALSVGVASTLTWLPQPAMAQQSPRGLTLQEARAAALSTSPDLAAARAAIAAASARARQAGAWGNPVLSYGYEQTAVGGQSTSQSIAALEQPLEFTGVRGARRDAAMLRLG